MDYTEKIDYSSVSTYLDCPRKFLFQYIMHFRSRHASIHLVFGSCWHYGLEVVYKRLMKDPDSLTVVDATELATSSFNLLWQIEGEPHFPDHDIIFPKSPGHASNMYYAYWNMYLNGSDATKEILAVESPFTINLSGIAKKPLPNYIGRQDLLYKLPDDTLEIIDHKTAKSIYPTTLSQFETSYQTDGYLTAGELYYDKIPKMTYNIALCQKSKIAFQRFTIIKRHAAIEQFLFEIINLIHTILRDIDLISHELENKKFRNDNTIIFPRTPGYACTAYFTPCPYLDLCKIRSNPLLWYNDPPQGFSINEWNPDTHEEEMRKKLKEIE